MKNIIYHSLLAFGAAIGFAGSTSAADMLLRAPPVAYWNWSGFYAGVHGGYGWGDVGDGGFAGGQIGYNIQRDNIQRDNILWGIELDSAWANIGGSDTAAISGVSVSATSAIDYVGSLRGRVDYAPGNALYYVTGGLALAHASLDVATAMGGISVSASTANTHLGWTLGGGAEWMVQRNWSMKLEYLYTEY